MFAPDQLDNDAVPGKYPANSMKQRVVRFHSKKKREFSFIAANSLMLACLHEIDPVLKRLLQCEYININVAGRLRVPLNAIDERCNP